MREQQKLEAIKRMNLLQLSKKVIEQFEKCEIINLSENGGLLYWLNEKEEKIVKEFERENNAIVYHVIHDFTEFGELYSILYVSEDKEEWQLEKEEIKDGYVFAYVKNVSIDWCSEFGSIGVIPRFGGLIRLI